MKYLATVYAWTVGLLYFALLCITGLILTFIIPGKLLDPWIKRALRLFFRILFIRVTVEAAEKINPENTYLFMANHVSLFDVLALEAYIPTFVRGVEAHYQFNWPLYGWAIRRLGNVPINRENAHASIRSIRKTEKLLRRGVSMVIMPEGHRTLDGRLRPFKKLPFFLAKEAGVDVVPIGLSGLFHLKRKGSWLIQPTTIKIRFGDIIPAEKVRDLSPLDLRELVRKEIESLVERP